MISTANSRLITGRFQTLTAWFERVTEIARAFSTAPTTTTVYHYNNNSFLKGDFFLRFEQVHKGEEDFLGAAIRHEIARREREEWDGLFRGLAWTLAAGTACAVAMGLPLSWQTIAGFFGAVGVVVIMLAVAGAAVWILWGRRSD